jgi:hypothetical protein
MSQVSENSSEDPRETPVTDIGESDPNADSREGLAGDMGLSSEWKGRVRGVDEEVTHAVAPTFDDERPEGDLPPEQSAYDRRPEVSPDPTGPHESDRDSNPGHG